jgi:hypothetical protein
MVRAETVFSWALAVALFVAGLFFVLAFFSVLDVSPEDVGREPGKCGCP